MYKTSLALHQSKEYYLSIHQKGHACILPIAIYKETAFRKMVNRDYLLDGIVYGLLLFIAVMGLLFFINSRNKLYLYYSLYILTAIIWFLSYFGVGFQYLWPNNPDFNTASSPLFAAANIFLNIQICQHLLGINRHHNKLYFPGLIAKIMLAIAGLFPLFINLNVKSYSLNHLYLVSFLSIIIYSVSLVLIYVLYYTMKGLLHAKFYFAASIIKVLSIFNLALLELGISPALYNMEEILQVGLLIEITLLTYALARNYSKQESYAREKERKKISVKIHNQISNYLTILRVKIYNYNKKLNISELNEIESDISKLQVDARNISINLRPDYLKNESLKDAIQNYLMQNNNDQITLTIKEEDLTITYALKEYIFEIIQELITNTIKHSGATEGNIEITINKKRLEIRVEDNGIGMGSIEENNNYGSGLLEIRGQVEKYHGSMTIGSGIKSWATGTIISILIPNPRQISTSVDSLVL